MKSFTEFLFVVKASPFGKSLSEQLAANQNAPTVLVLCTEELERRACDRCKSSIEILDGVKICLCHLLLGVSKGFKTETQP